MSVNDDQGAVISALKDGTRCLLCIGIAAHVPPRRVADALSAVSEDLSMELMSREGRCQDCSQYRFVFRLAKKVA